MKKSKVYLISLAAILFIVIIWIITGSGPESESTVKVPVKSGKFDIVIPTAWLNGTADVLGRPVERQVSGFADPRFRVSWNFYGLSGK